MLCVDGTGIPLAFILASANVSEYKLALPTMDEIAVNRRPLHPKKRPDIVVADKGYDAEWLREALRKRHIIPKIPKRDMKGDGSVDRYNNKIQPYYQMRWIVERTNAWLQNYRRITVRWDRNWENYEGFIEIGCILICLKRV